MVLRYLRLTPMAVRRAIWQDGATSSIRPCAIPGIGRSLALPTGFAHDEGTDLGTDLTLSRSRFYQIERRGTSW